MGNCQQIQNSKDDELKMNQKENNIFLAVKIWSKKSNELFNYEARSYKEQKYNLMKHETLPKQLRQLFWRSEDDGLMIFNPNKSFSSTNDKQEKSLLSKWVNLSSLDRTQGIEIKVNDVYKFGNTLLKVKDIYFQNHQAKVNNSFDLGGSTHQNCCQGNQICKKISINSIKNQNQIENDQYQRICQDKCCKKQCQLTSSQKGCSSKYQNNDFTNLINANNNQIVIQKATTMMLNSKLQGQDEYNEDFNNMNDSNLISVQQFENGEKVQNINCKKKKKILSNLKSIESQKQCRICLETEEEEEEEEDKLSNQGSDQLWQNINRQTEDLSDNQLNIMSQIMQHQSNISTRNATNQDITQKFGNNHQTFGNNPMISICGCQGSMKYVHLKCLQTWVKSKQLLNDSFSSRFCEYYSQKAMICELCKKNYPLKININGKNVFLLQIDEEDLEEDTNIIYPISTSSRQESNANQLNIVNQNNQGNILQIDNEDNDDDHQNVQEEQVDENNNSPFENHENYNNEDEQDNQNKENDEDDDEDQEEDEEENNEEQEEEQKTNWNNKKNKTKRKNFDNYAIFEIQNSQNSFLNGLIILNLMKTYENQQNVNKTSNFTSTKKQQVLKNVFSLGRQNSCDIKINDITVSRFHAEIKVDYEKGRILLKDTNSKFGTLIKLRKELVINTKLDGVQVQINNVCIEFIVGQDPQQEFYKRTILQKNNNQQNDKQSICQFSNCCKSVSPNKNENEIIINDNNFKFKDKYFHPIDQLHDQV